MRKFLAVVKREYVQRVRAKMFIVSTVLLPLAMSLFGIVPAIILNMESSPQRVAVVDQTGKMYGQLKQALSSEQANQQSNSNANDLRRSRSLGNFLLEEVKADNQSIEQLKANLDQRLRE